MSRYVKCKVGMYVCMCHDTEQQDEDRDGMNDLSKQDRMNKQINKRHIISPYGIGRRINLESSKIMCGVFSGLFLHPACLPATFLIVCARDDELMTPFSSSSVRIRVSLAPSRRI